VNRIAITGPSVTGGSGFIDRRKTMLESGEGKSGPVQSQVEDQIRTELQELARDIKAGLPHGFGFVLLVTSSKPGAALLYVSTLERADVLQMMREFIATNRDERNWQREMPEVELSEEFDQWWAAQLKRKGIENPNMAEWCRDGFTAEWCRDGFTAEWCRDAFNAGRASA
jgi:hypothetical protein